MDALHVDYPRIAGCCSFGKQGEISLSKADFILFFVRNDTIDLSFRVIFEENREKSECVTAWSAGLTRENKER